MRTFLRYFIISTLFVIFLQKGNIVYSQVVRSNIDSLYKAYIESHVDSERVSILLQLSTNTKCEDSVRKFSFASNAYKIAQKIKWDRGRLNCNTVLGHYYSVCLRQYSKAIEYHQNSAYLAETLKDTMSEALAMVHIAKNYENLGQHDKALSYLNDVLRLNADPDVNMGALGDIGAIYNVLGDYRQALIFYNKALDVLDALIRSKAKGSKQDTVTKGGLLLNIGDIYLSMSQIDRALEKYNNVNRLGAVINNQYLRFFSVMAIGKAYFVKKNYTMAIKNLDLALFDSKMLKQVMYEAAILDELANAYIAIGAIEKAQQSALASLKIVEDNQYEKQYPKTYTTLGKLLSLQGNYKDAVTHFQLALDYCRKTNEIEDEKNAWEELSNAYDKMNQPAKALVAYRHFISLRDSLYNIDKANELVRIDLQAGFNQKQMADSLKHVKQTKAYEGEMQKQQVFTYGILIGLVLVMLLAFFMYRNYSIQKKFNDLLSKEKAKHLAYIEAQSNALTDFAHIQSHDIRGPVSTLLGLVKVFNFDNPNDPDNKEVIEGIAVVTERLDKIVTDLVSKENKFSTNPEFKDTAKKK